MSAESLQEILQSVDADGIRLAYHFAVTGRAAIRRSYRDVVGLDAQEFKALLYGDADGTAAAPEADDEIGTKVRSRDIRGKLKRIPEQVVRGDEALFHCFSRPAVR